MKKKIILIFITLLSFQNRNFSQNSNPSIDETIEWIESKMNFSDINILNEHYSFKINIDKKKKEMIIEKIIKQSDGSYRHEVHYLPIQKIDLNNIQIKESDGDYFISLFAINNNHNTFRQESWNDKDKPNDKITLHDSEENFVISSYQNKKNPNLPERFKTALINLIKLYGGKGEKF